MEYRIIFDPTNENCILIKQGDKLITAIATPPCNYGTDIININNEDLHDGYNYKFKGLIVMTDRYKKTLIYDGRIIRTIYRNENRNKKIS